MPPVVKLSFWQGTFISEKQFVTTGTFLICSPSLSNVSTVSSCYSGNMETRILDHLTEAHASRFRKLPLTSLLGSFCSPTHHTCRQTQAALEPV
jgi:hypothetical protein